MKATTGLSALEDRVRHDLSLLSFPDKEWVRALPAADEEQPLDCAVIGGGQIGLSIAFGLKRENVSNVMIFDENPAGREGPWATFARMTTMRTPKVYSGPEYGIPSLTFRAWYEAQHGATGWDELFRIPRLVWMDYLNWFKGVLGLAVTNETRLTGIRAIGERLFQLSIESPQGTSTVQARTIAIATGTNGAGVNRVPPFIEALPREVWRHSNETFDPSLFAGKRVGVLGTGASAFDNAIAAIEAGAVSADICSRRNDLPRQNPRRFLESSGFLSQYQILPDSHKWRYVSHLHAISQPPPAPTFERAISLPQITIRTGLPWTDARMTRDGAIAVQTPQGEQIYDFLVPATGVTFELDRRTELRDIADKIALWEDRYSAPDGLASPDLTRMPYLGQNGELLEKTAGSAPWLKRIFMLNGAATLSMGPTAGSNSTMRYSVPLLVDGIVRELFLDGADEMLADMLATTYYELTDEMIARIPAASESKKPGK